MSIRVQCCAAVVMLVLLYFYRRQRRIGLRTGRAYWRMFCMAFVSIAFDIVSCVAITNMTSLPKILPELACKTYLASLGCLSGFVLQYLGADIFKDKTQYRRVMMIFSAFIFAGVTMIYLLPISYHAGEGEGQLYTYGPSVTATYAFAGTTIFGIFLSILLSRHKINKDRRNGVIIGIGCILTAAVIQFLNNQLLMVGFAESICMVVLFLWLENPGYYIDVRTGLFNQNAFNLYTTQLYQNHSDFSLIQIIYEPGSCRSQSIDELLTEVVNFLLTVPNILTFKNVGNEIVVIVENTEDPKSSADLEDSSNSEGSSRSDVSAVVLKKLRKRFEDGWGKSRDVEINPYWIYVPDAHIVNNTGELVNMLRYVRQNSTELMETHFTEVGAELAESINEEKLIGELIANALNDDRVEVFYQPIYSTRERAFTAAEALVRIRDEFGNIVPPGKFIGVAESNGMILKLGETVFRKVCRFLSENDRRSIGLRYIEVNLSMVQCANDRLASDYIGIMKEHGVTPDMINLEITESASLEAKATLLQNMRRLIDFGVSFSLDDFGTGHSNLNYIIDMPVEIVKFDREMTNAYFENSKAKYIMDAAMDMIHGMDLNIVSEGVETEDQLRVMEDLNINYIQGFLFSKPLPESEFLEFLRERNTDHI